jgi:FdhD protein
MNRRASVAPIVRIQGHTSHTDQDLVAVESPLAIVLVAADGGRRVPLGVAMRTPGDDDDLVTGLLYSERIIRRASQILRVTTDAPESGEEASAETLTVTLSGDVDFAALPSRAVAATSACGLCGRVGVTALAQRGGTAEGWRISPEAIAAVPLQLRERQRVFAETGGLHAAALCDDRGAAWLVREDVGRHNAVDKVFGAALRSAALPATRAILGLSGRIGFEIVQKAAVAGVRAIVAVGAPSSLAVEAARSADLTLIGFARDGRCNVYSGAHRVGVNHSG